MEVRVVTHDRKPKSKQACKNTWAVAVIGCLGSSPTSARVQTWRLLRSLLKRSVQGNIGHEKALTLSRRARASIRMYVPIQQEKWRGVLSARGACVVCWHGFTGAEQTAEESAVASPAARSQL